LAPREQPSVLYCWRRLEMFDDALAEAFASRDNRVFSKLESDRKWWVDQLEFALYREGFPRREDDATVGTRRGT
jgi:hypothetical protein